MLEKDNMRGIFVSIRFFFFYTFLGWVIFVNMKVI